MKRLLLVAVVVVLVLALGLWSMSETHRQMEAAAERAAD